MSYLERNEAIKRIKAALKRKTGKTWSVTGGRGTGWGWVDVQAPPARRIWHIDNPAWNPQLSRNDKTPRCLEVPPTDEQRPYAYTSRVECEQLAKAFGLDRPVHFQGLQISPDEREFYTLRAES